MAPPASAMSVANALRSHLLAAGVPQVSIELQIGRSGRWVSTGSHGGTSFVANLGHHIASNPSATNPTPGLGVVKNGRPGLNGPLCNGYGGMDLIARIICLDWANHPGEGGPWTINGVTIPRDGGRPYLFGWEHEGGFSTAVWDATYTNKATGRRMTYREFMGRCHAGTLRFLGRPRTAHGEHSTWADLKQVGRKIDRLGYGHPRGTAATKGINELTPYYTQQEEDDMFTDDDRAILRELRSVQNANQPQRLQRADTDGTASIRFGVQKIWEAAHYLRHVRVPFNNMGKERWPNDAAGYNIPTYMRASFIYDKALYEDLTRIAIPLLQQIRAAQGQSANQEVLEQIQASLQQAETDRQEIRNRLDAAAVAAEQSAAEILALVEQVGDGSVATERALELVREKLAAAGQALG